MLVSTNPATGAEVGRVQTTPVSDIAAVVARARAAQPAWAALSFEERAAILARGGESLKARAAEVTDLLTREMGKPLSDARGEVRWIVGAFTSDLKELAEALAPEVREKSGRRTTVYRDAFGVALCISPWNFPLAMPHQQVLPALAAGNTVVLKPSEETPLVAQAYVDCLLPHLPEGVLQIVHGDEAQGKALVSSDVDLVVFTGSRAAGVHILGEASKQLKRVILELGGKDPLVVLDDADVPAAAAFAARNSFRNAGQVCVSTERIYVAEPVHDAFVEAMVDAAKAMTVGDGLADGTQIGPMVSLTQKAHVKRQVAEALADGAQVAWSEGTDAGQFLGPIVLTECTHDMNIARDETFGPVACVYRVQDDAEAVRLANDTPYGLGAVVYGGTERARAVARQMTAGMVGVNQGLGSLGSTPWVGARQSGYGFHSSVEGHRQFAQVRVVSETF